MSIWVVNFFGAIVLGGVLVQWLFAAKTYGYLPLSLFLPMLKLSVRTRQTAYLYPGLALLLSVICSVFDYFPPNLVFLQISLGLSAILRVCLPPSILFLGLGRESNSEMYEKMAWNYPLKITHMLGDPLGYIFQTNNEDEHHKRPTSPIKLGLDQLAWHAIKDEGYRALDELPDGWIPVVKQFMVLAPVILIDTQIVDNWILFETQTVIVSPDILAKTFFIVKPSGKSPVLELLEYVGFNVSSLHISTVPADEFALFLRHLRRRLMFGGKHQDISNYN